MVGLFYPLQESFAVLQGRSGTGHVWYTQRIRRLESSKRFQGAGRGPRSALNRLRRQRSQANRLELVTLGLRITVTRHLEFGGSEGLVFTSCQHHQGCTPSETFYQSTRSITLTSNSYRKEPLQEPSTILKGILKGAVKGILAGHRNMKPQAHRHPTRCDCT